MVELRNPRLTLSPDHDYTSKVSEVAASSRSDSTPPFPGSQARMDSMPKNVVNEDIETISDEENVSTTNSKAADPVSMAMSINDIEVYVQHEDFVAAFETVNCPQPATPSGSAKDTPPLQPSLGTEPPTLDEDRQAEDALEMVENSHVDIRNDPVVLALTAALKRSRRTNTEQEKKMDSLIRLP